jgi:predicted nuclease of predicted toxin-antitoxin system
LRFLVDAQLPPALARRIEAFGHVAEHVSDCGLASAADRDIRAYAVNVGAVIITKDEDFVVRKMLESGPAGDFRKASPEVASSE